MGLGLGVGAVGGFGVLMIGGYLVVIYALVFWIAVPAISIVAKMFGFPG